MREVTVENGILSGIPCGWPSITAFYGIPYAAPPVGGLRWRPPQPAADWEGVRDCARASAKCPQLGVGPGSFYEKEFYPYEESMDEDCLYLNVWTPARKPEEKLPVIFWVHGGAFMTGYGHSAHFDGEHFARQDVILVTINYRLNVFGWMVHPELSAESERGISGNYGLLDQIYALKWVRRNITGFGGDPDNITVAGQSAGAMSVHALISSPLTKGDIRKAILQSGGGMTTLPDMRCPKLSEVENTIDLPSALGVNSIAEARELSWQELLDRWRRTMPGQALQRAPVVDGYVLPKGIDEIGHDQEYHDIPYLMGVAADEGLISFRNQEDFEELIHREFGADAEEFIKLAVSGGLDYDAYKGKSFMEFMLASCLAWAELLESHGKGPVYLYYLDRKLPGDEMGAFHAADLWYVFKTFMRSWRPWTGADYELASACNTYWANFAKTGNPNGETLPEWTPYTKEHPKLMELGEYIGMMNTPENPRVAYRKKFLLKE